jgi:hypothetical protein
MLRKLFGKKYPWKHNSSPTPSLFGYYLPIEVTIYLLSEFLEGKEILKLGVNNKAWRNMVAEDTLWRRVMEKEREFPIEENELTRKMWRELYICKYIIFPKIFRGSSKKVIQVNKCDNKSLQIPRAFTTLYKNGL